MSNISQLFRHHNILFNLLSMRIVNIDLFPISSNWQICHTYQAFKLPFCNLSSKLWTFQWNQDNWMSSWLNSTTYSSSLWKRPHKLLLEKKLLNCYCDEVPGLCYTTQHMWLSYVQFENHLKCLAERLYLIVLHMCVSLVKGGKDWALLLGPVLD